MLKKNLLTKKEMQQVNAYIAGLWVVIITLLLCLLCGCGSVVKATVHNPQNTAKTTITISTNTPVETTVTPDTKAEVSILPKQNN